MVEAKEHAVEDFLPGKGIELVDVTGRPIEGLRFKVELSDGSSIEGTTKKDGLVLVPVDEEGETKIEFPVEDETGSSDEPAEGQQSGEEVSPTVHEKRFDLEGDVTDEDGHTPVEVELLIRREEDGTEFRVRTDSEGRFQLQGTKPGKHTVTVISSGFKGETKHDISAQ